MIAIYAGSYDPITNGHENVVARGSRIFENLILGIGDNISKTSLFCVDERIELANKVCQKYENVQVMAFEGLLVNFAKRVGASVILRGFRALTEGEQELALSHTNYQLCPEVDTLLLPARVDHSFVSSSAVKEIARHGGDVSYYVDPIVAAALREKYKRG